MGIPRCGVYIVSSWGRARVYVSKLLNLVQNLVRIISHLEVLA